MREGGPRAGARLTFTRAELLGSVVLGTLILAILALRWLAG